ncbi:amino acid ABC transporter substrate-binding protein, PAAT family [Tistlia consotensis]|uniref:Amino acid ABC transporter substrate-binding protein, PAAT family n=1 Tax=Tistlia consotensis USBA 355 TaxID=560819 RepID=A0A1Y6BMW0_9PROT|nr:ABC transporter substrate-binding protein [Tistlia consotensis]SMF11750.1 amino acid ABC transporter substrate-binding protein, PAAT family [Tistlia consotensis USBA 355]SNR51687.1 amino acid ABC transporter substrate-binding protein, PAAT family [Tistlia consotensis]
MRKLVFALAAVAALGLVGGAAHAEMKKVRIGTEGAYPPFNYIDQAGKLQGFDIEIAKALCAAAKFDCEFVVQDWDGIIPGLIAKKYDAIVASMSITAKRKEVVDFTDKYYNTPAKFVKAKSLKLEIPDDVAAADKKLAGMRVGVQRATIHENYLRAKFPDVEIVPYATQDEANLDLSNGRVDLVMADSVALSEGFLKTPAGKDFEFVGPDYNDPKYHGDGAGIAVRKGDDELRLALNKAIAEIRANGTYKKINDKWFDFDVYGK